jgi:hypothetical protein
MQMAKQLIESMTSEWKPELYTDEYHKALEKMIEVKIEHGDEALPVPTKKKKPTNIVDLVSVFEQSIRQTQAKPKVGEIYPQNTGGAAKEGCITICQVRDWRPLACVGDCHGWRRLQPPGSRLHARVRPGRRTRGTPDNRKKTKAYGSKKRN